ncbi:hypothetical protein OIU84_018747 [Salix udensis]|uniref:Leucine-rich repeat-containing N-terminal plant-type domain-containing protein n=1 Tax=Salix udensis TaxID=889485 RepID=A0AAD6PI93_9ROSI|nr:hypothetical protein OIU84_018747 [Salix udensis]
MAKERTCFQISFLISLYLFSKFVSLEATKLSPNSTISNAAGCMELERRALLRIKQGFKDPSGQLSSWVDKDCSGWSGSVADYKFSCLSGEISLSLLELKYFNHLDLSWNDFQGETNPEYIGSLSELSYLDLSRASFSGLAPPHLGNLSNLRYLNLYSDSYQSSVANMLPSLSNCDLRNFPDSLPTTNLSVLRILLYLSNNDISGEIDDLVEALSGCGNASLEALQLVLCLKLIS